jgi:hypothetical protein
MSLHLQLISGNSSKSVAYHHSGVGWIAGARAIVEDDKSGRQILISSRRNRTLNCLNFSPCGGYIALGEGGCLEPELQLFDVSTGEIQWWTTTVSSVEDGDNNMQQIMEIALSLIMTGAQGGRRIHHLLQSRSGCFSGTQ